MPIKPKRPCAYPGCPELTAGRYCGAHKKLTDQQYDRYGRDPASKKRYGRTWRKVRERFLQAHPLCEECLKQGRTIPATEAHHILPLSQGGANDMSNLEGLCKSHHSALHLRERSREKDGRTTKR